MCFGGGSSSVITPPDAPAQPADQYGTTTALKPGDTQTTTNDVADPAAGKVPAQPQIASGTGLSSPIGGM